MAHHTQFNFVRACKGRWPRFFTNTKVIEHGSRNVNGSVRRLFTDCDYVGVDYFDGKDVDVKTIFHEYKGEAGSFDVAISCQALEHDPYWKLSLRQMLYLLKPGGLFILTWPQPWHPEHGTRRRPSPYDHDRIYAPLEDHYYAPELVEVFDVVIDEVCDLMIGDGSKPADQYFSAIKCEDV